MRTAVSLHSHSTCSRESLAFLPDFARRIPLVSRLLEHGTRVYQRTYGRPIDFSDWYWRPPLAPADVIASEQSHLEQRLGLDVLVSLTDHDTLEGPRRLRASGHRDVPLSFEWTVPFERCEFHLGVHSLDPRRAGEIADALTAYTNRDESAPAPDIAELLAWLCESPETLVILNHPYWDMGGVGQMRHDSTLLAFLRAHRDHIHGLELNGYRTWNENRRVLPLATGFAIPVVGGGDRHGYIPNAIVNLSRAGSLAGFAHELRVERRSQCVIFPEYLDPFPARILRNASDVLAPERRAGRPARLWDERVFTTSNGVEQPMSTLWNGPPAWLAAAVATARLMASHPFSPLLGLRRSDGQESLESDCIEEFAAPAHTAPGSVAAA